MMNGRRELRRVLAIQGIRQKSRAMSIEDLTSIHDDMDAFAQGLGLRRFHGYIPDEMPSVLWDNDDVNESWKDFLELAHATGAPFITMNSVRLEADDVEFLLAELRRSSLSREEDLETARQLRSYLGRIGFIQLGFPYQGVMFLCELSTEWYEGYKALQEMADDLGGIMIDGSTDGSEEDER
jgi:hypothetical protein